MEKFKFECKRYLHTLGIGELRAYGRHIGVERPTTKNKDELIDSIVGVLSGEIPAVPCSKLGAPVLNNHINPEIPEVINRYHVLYVNNWHVTPASPDLKPVDERIKEFRASGQGLLRVQSSASSKREAMDGKVYRGQVETLNSVTLLLPLDCIEEGRKIVFPMEILQEYDVKEGDVVDCHVEVGESCNIARDVLAINGIPVERFRRNSFQNSDVCFPSQRIPMKPVAEFTKFLQWIMPIGKGQRAMVSAAPKAGKTHLLQELAQAVKDNDKLEVIALLVDQSPETVTAYRKVVNKDNLLFTTYDHDPDRQVFVAEYALKRAKSFVESGQDVLLILDSFNAFARAYNDTDLSSGGKMLACGLESKTVQYLKKYFGAARCIENGGSLTIVGAITAGTGNPADEYLAAELSALSNWTLYLDEKLAYKRIYPALNMEKSYANANVALLSNEERASAVMFYERYAVQKDVEGALQLLRSESYSDFAEKLLNQ